MSGPLDVLKRHRVFLITLALILLMGAATLYTLHVDANHPAPPESTARHDPLAPGAGDTRARREAKRTLPPVENAAPISVEVKKQLKEVMSGPDFNQNDSQLALIPRKPEKKDESKDVPDWLKWLGKLFSPATANAITWVMWVLAAVLAVFIVWMVFNWFRRWQRERIPTTQDENAAIRVALKLDQLPDDILAEAERAWTRGDATLALSLLYRGALKHLLDVRGLKLRTSLTEGECMRAVQHQMGGDTSLAFNMITGAWSQMAYAARAPSEFATLASTYRRAFESAVTGPAVIDGSSHPRA